MKNGSITPIISIDAAVELTGLKEKLLAAKMAGMKTVLVPEENKSDVEELEAEITDGLSIVYVENISQVIKEALFTK